jgi:hypothetical protein
MVVAVTSSMMARLTGPSAQEGKGSDCASSRRQRKSTTKNAKAPVWQYRIKAGRDIIEAPLLTAWEKLAASIQAHTLI